MLRFWILLMKFIRTPHFALFQLCFKKFYSASSGADPNILYCDRNKINRRNVKTDVTSTHRVGTCLCWLSSREWLLLQCKS